MNTPVDVVALAAELLAIPSTTRDEGAAVDSVARWLVARDWNVTVQEVTPGRGNIWASRKGGGVTLSTHLDTVPPYVPPRRAEGRLYGRGACDAKGIAAAMMVAADRLVHAGEERVDLLFVVGEERGSDGARLANQLPATSKWLINGEPTESVLASGCKGAQRVIVRTKGREAHSAYAHLGESAITPMLQLLQELQQLKLPEDPILGPSTVNVGLIRGGTEANIVPGTCEAEMMFRLVGDVAEIKKVLKPWAQGRAELEYGSHIPAQHFHTVPGFKTAPMAYTSDIPLLGNWGTPLLFGPGSIHVAHTPDEYIEETELRASVDSYVTLVKHLLHG
ncbi:M20/M25/M40 family metallo-hydrolase [Pseudogemmatithrix spongiicola]|uniref:M20/M25/M40 family metallo-hydrolase n=1 Tax=Pseudogemmatithrix spongiicola TaxID=3062599 RepID=A0AA49JVI0_9BACT|nr:M20/M25/M40 family metallo-hydrolase [Gemmatimonadaceae bacterium 'strain 138']WKW15300.1 M20/M25/M40 family metallo-hydrolase [Gemmatimonadaceae bacterium 'strain 318']